MLPSEDLAVCYPTVPSFPLNRAGPFHLILISSHFVLVKDGANGLELIRQRCDYQDVHYVVYGRDCSVSACCAPAAAASDAVAATVSSDRSSSFCLALLVRVVPKCRRSVVRRIVCRFFW